MYTCKTKKLTLRKWHWHLRTIVLPEGSFDRTIVFLRIPMVEYTECSAAGKQRRWLHFLSQLSWFSPHTPFLTNRQTLVIEGESRSVILSTHFSQKVLSAGRRNHADPSPKHRPHALRCSPYPLNHSWGLWLDQRRASPAQRDRGGSRQVCVWCWWCFAVSPYPIIWVNTRRLPRGICLHLWPVVQVLSQVLFPKLPGDVDWLQELNSQLAWTPESFLVTLVLCQIRNWNTYKHRYIYSHTHPYTSTYI